MSERAWMIARRAWRDTEIKVSDREVLESWINEIKPLVERIEKLRTGLKFIEDRCLYRIQHADDYSKTVDMIPISYNTIRLECQRLLKETEPTQ